MDLKKKSNLMWISVILILILIIVGSLTLVKKSFNGKEIENLTTKCLENEADYNLTITNRFTSAYTFECHPPK